jgi:hypothetical protein
MFSGEAANTNFLVFSLTWQWFDQTVDPTVVWPDVYGLIRLHREPNIYPVRGKHANYYTNDSVETGYILSECCLSCEQHFIYIMTRTTFHLYHDKNNILSISWQEQHFIYIMTRTNYLMRWWWCWHCTEPTPTVGFKNNQQKNMFLIHTILTQSQPVFALNPKCGVEKQPLLILWFDPIVNQILNLLPSERAREPLL